MAEPQPGSEPAKSATSTLPISSTYIAVDKLTSSEWNAYIYANDLVKSVNSSNTEAIDLTTPLQKTLFDLQEIDTSIHTLTSRNALAIIQHTANQNATAQNILSRVDEERARLTTSFDRLRTEVMTRYEAAEKSRQAASRSLETLNLLRQAQKLIALARRFEALSDSKDHGSYVQCANVILEFKLAMTQVTEASRLNIVKTIRGRVFEDGEARILDWAKKTVREFSVTGVNYGVEDVRARFTSAVYVLYLLSPALHNDRKSKEVDFEPEYLLTALQGYLQAGVSQSSAAIGRGLKELPVLDRALAEVSAKCQNIIAFERILGGIHPPQHMLLEQERKEKRLISGEAEDEEHIDTSDDDDSHEDITQKNLLEPLLGALDTRSLASWFWRSLASQMANRVGEVLNRGGVAARTLKANKETVRGQLRECVLRGSKVPTALLQHSRDEVLGNWEREAAVMAGSIIGPLSR